MTHTLKVRQIGSSMGVIVPKDVLNQLNLTKGDNLYLVEGQEGYRLVVNDPGFDVAMKSYKKISKRYRNALRELAK